MNKTLKSLVLLFLGLLLCGIYFVIALLRAELNPFIWPQEIRGAMLLCVCLYLVFIPLMMSDLEDYI